MTNIIAGISAKVFLVSFLSLLCFFFGIVASVSALGGAIITPSIFTTDGTMPVTIQFLNTTVNDSSNTSYHLPNISDFIFLYSGADCSTAPNPAASQPTQVTALATVAVVNDIEEITTDISSLANGTYQVCWASGYSSPAAVYPTDYVTLGEVKMLHSVYMTPKFLNIDLQVITVTTKHIPIGYSIFLLLTIEDGVPTGLGCRDIETGNAVETDLTKRTPVVVVSGTLTADINVTGLAVGEYQICVSNGVFVDFATTPYLSLPTREYLVRSKLCTGGGITGICLVSPTYTDQRLLSQIFYLYPARPKTYGFLLRKNKCGVATYTCGTGADHATIPTAFASPIARVGFDRKLTIDMTNLVPGDYVFCALNITADSVPSTALYHEVTAATISVAGSIDPSQTVVTCCSGGNNTFVAGTDQWCTVYTYDLYGSPSGISADTCQLVAMVRDRNNADVCNTSQLYWRDVGRFTFRFTPNVSGVTTATIAHFNMTGTNTDGTQTIAYSGVGAAVTIIAAAFDETNSISTCYRSGAVDICSITNRDQFGNTVGTCTSRSDDVFSCNGAVFP